MTNNECKKTLANVRRRPAEGKSYQTIMNESDSVAFLLALVDFGNWPVRELDVELKRVPEERQIVVLIDAFCGKIQTDGIEDLVDDPAIGGLLPELLACCKTIGASSAIAYLERMLKCFPEGTVPLDEIERIEMLEAIKRRENIANFRVLDKEFSTSIQETVQALRDYISQNTDRFENVLSHPR